jgi:hypothetical protein
MIKVIKNVNFPQFRFEYHPEIGKVYVMPTPTPGAKLVAEVIAEHCDTEGRAFGFVQTWCRGYREGQKSPTLVGV